MENERAISRIRKALNLARENSNENEAQTAMLMAQRLMTKHGIDMSEVEGADAQDEKEVVDEQVTAKTKTPYWKKALGLIIAENFRCYCYTRSGGGKSSIYFLGMKEDVELSKELLEFAVNVLQQSTKQYLKKQKELRGPDYDRAGLRNDYILGFVDGLKDKFKEQVEELALAPMLVKDQDLVAEYEARNFKSGSTSYVQRNYDKSAYTSGHKQGKSLTKDKSISN